MASRLRIDSQWPIRPYCAGSTYSIPNERCLLRPTAPPISARAWRSLVTLEVPRGGVCQAEIATALGRGDGRISSAG